MPNKKKPFFFTEDGNKIIYTDSGFSSVDYKNIFSIHDVADLLNIFKLKKTKEFDDMYVFFNSSIEIVVWLKNEDDFYEESFVNKNIKQNNYTKIVKNIIFTLQKQAKKEQVNSIISLIMSKFDLNVYDPNNNVIIKDAKDIK